MIRGYVWRDEYDKISPREALIRYCAQFGVEAKPLFPMGGRIYWKDGQIVLSDWDIQGPRVHEIVHCASFAAALQCALRGVVMTPEEREQFKGAMVSRSVPSTKVYS